MCRSLFLSVCIFLVVGAPAPDKREEARKLFLARAPFHEAGSSSRPKSFSCLAKDVQANEVVSYGPKGRQGVTVEKTLIEMKARCRKGKLVDAKGREVRFFRPSCWGNPPPDYLEIRQREDAELAKLKKHYAVIVFGCNPMIQ
jgi:hypothetical protein